MRITSEASPNRSGSQGPDVDPVEDHRTVLRLAIARAVAARGGRARVEARSPRSGSRATSQDRWTGLGQERPARRTGRGWQEGSGFGPGDPRRLTVAQGVSRTTVTRRF